MTTPRRRTCWFLAALLALTALLAPADARAQNRGKPPARDTTPATRPRVRRDTARLAPRRPARDTAGAKPAADSARPAPQPVTLPPVRLVLAPPRPDAWRGYSLRSIGYVGAMAAGLILATGKDTDPTHDDLYSFHRPKNRTGLAVAAAAAVVGLTDALITAHHVRARAAVRAPDRGRTRTGLRPPSVDADGRSAHIALVRLSF